LCRIGTAIHSALTGHCSLDIRRQVARFQVSDRLTFELTNTVVFDAMALNPASLALTAARQWLSVLRSGGSKKRVSHRYSDRKSTIFCTQIDVPEWLSLLGNNLMAESIMDRIIHNAVKILLNGDSMRKRMTPGS